MPKCIGCFVINDKKPIFALLKIETKRNNNIMSRICEITGKRPRVGNKVSHSNIKTKRKFYPNLQTKRFYIPEEDKWITLKVAASTIRTINKIGITTVLKNARKKGNISV